MQQATEQSKNFSGLVAFEDQISTLAKNRNQKTDKYIRKAFEKLEVANRQGFKDLAPLEEACTLLIDALRFNRQDLRPYLSLSYLFSLVDNYEIAEEYLTAALELEPEQPILQAWAEVLNEQQQDYLTRQSTPDLPQLSQDQAEHPQQLFEQLQSFIQKQIHQLMNQTELKPTLLPDRLKSLRDSLEAQQAISQQIGSKLKQLARRIDVSSLQELCRPLDATQRRYQSVLGVSLSLLEIRDQSQALEAECMGLIEQVRELKQASGIEPLIGAMESLMDHCDNLADRLDGIEKQRVDIRPVEGFYNQLLSGLTLCQKQVDAKIEALNKARRQRIAELPPEPSTAGTKQLLKGLGELQVFADRLWHLLPLDPCTKAMGGLYAFCQAPESAKLQRIVSELLDTLQQSESLHKAQIYGLLALIFHSYRKPLLAIEYLDYAQSLGQELAFTERLETLLKPLRKPLAGRVVRQPLVNGVIKMIATLSADTDKMSQRLLILLPSNGSQPAGSLYIEALALLCDFCMLPIHGSLLQAADRLLASLAAKQEEAPVYALLSTLFLSAGKASLGLEYLKYAQALNPGLPEASLIQAGFEGLRAIAPLAGDAQISPKAAVRKPALKGIANLLQLFRGDLAQSAARLKSLLPPAELLQHEISRQESLALQSFGLQPGQTQLKERSESLVNLLSSPTPAEAELHVLLGTLLASCGKPLLLLEFLDYAQQLEPDSVWFEQLRQRLSRPKPTPKS
jgi:tetratricopeptide (TPR) repeat protein